MSNTNFQTIHQMGNAISNVVKQASGRDPVQNIDMDFVTVAQNKTFGEMSYTGNPVSFNTPRPVQIQRILLGMEAKQAGSGDPSPENVRSITGRTGVNVHRTGKNIFPNAGDITVLGSTRFLYNYPIILSGETVTISANIEIASGFNSCTFFFIRKNASGIGNKFLYNGANAVTWTATEDVYGLNLYATASSSTNPGQTTLYNDFQIEIGSTATAYEPYNGTTIPVTFPDPPGTVYKGTLDLISGQLTVTHLMQTFTGAESEDWLNSYGSNGFRIASRGMKVGLLNPGLCNWLPVLSEMGNEMGVALGANDSDIYVRHITDNLEIADLTEWRAYLAEHPLEIFYPLEPAQYYQVTPQDLNTLAGDNVIWTDADTMEVMYYQMGEVI